ncbi:hypothetical protein FC093_06855 [Ilyomonas limi]|uniref:DUF4251 domain-containing protein n=1 Tax=Ilyomonas limi TaxID=2575867 RepID=A0A4V5UUR8_9BACT|nr:hypothetical protein [Ilyomonas limi]TKK69793.1 hypothetical protein FC093_06855 [Ilyomonas limi]
MKSFIIAVIFVSSAAVATAQQQDLSKYLATAKSSYSANKLEDAHFALQQAIAEVDILTGKKVLQMLPATLDTMSVDTKQDNVYANSGFIGATIHRTWGQGGTQTAELDIINNSPLIGTLSAFLNTPIIGGMMNSEKSKAIKIQGYKGRLNNDGENTTGPSDYSLQIPLNTALVTFKVTGATQDQVIKYANSLPLQQIAKLIQ